MARNGEKTRGAIMDAAEALILDQGFAATSVDQVIERAGITKGAFFYHFPTKSDLAHALVSRYAEMDLGYLRDHLARAEALSRDPLQQVLIFVGLFHEKALELTEPYPGCLFASYCYEEGLFDQRTLGVIVETMGIWQETIAGKLARAMEQRPPRLPATPRALADMLTVIFEGAFILSKVHKEPRVIAEQLLQYRNYLELLFGLDHALTQK